MNRVKPTIFEFDRRSFTKAVGAFGFSAMFFRPQDLLAQNADEVCIQTNPQPEDTESLQFWIDGLHLGGLSNIASRANVALFVEILQQEEEYVEAVVFTDSSGNILGAQYFDVTQKMSSGHVPHVVFENVALNHMSNYYVYYQLRVGSNVKLYQYKIEQPERTHLFKSYLPKIMRDDFEASQGENNGGLISSPYQFYTQNGLTAHCARGSVIDINSDNTFRIDVALMHGDAGDDHYMRYFIIADPVGRILGFVKRDLPSLGGTTPDTTVKGGAGMMVSQLNDQQIDDNEIEAKYVAKINDCPYVQIFTEDVFDALARSIIRLR